MTLIIFKRTLLGQDVIILNGTMQLNTSMVTQAHSTPRQKNMISRETNIWREYILYSIVKN